jgi:hypothetical protein
MRNRIFNIGKSVLPLVAVLALAFVLAQFHFAAGAGTVVAASGQTVCSQPCDPGNCPQPCAKDCTGMKSAACPAQATTAATSGCSSACKMAGSGDCSKCPVPCTQPCQMGSSKCATKTVAQVK